MYVRDVLWKHYFIHIGYILHVYVVYVNINVCLSPRVMVLL